MSRSTPSPVPVRAAATPVDPWAGVSLVTVKDWAMKALCRECQADLALPNPPTSKELHDWVVWLLDNRPTYTP